MTDSFPLCKKAALEHYLEAGDYNITQVIEAKHVEAFLQKAEVVYGCPDKKFAWANKEERRGIIDTHSARIILIEPIVKKSREERLEELIRHALEHRKMDQTWVDDAQALLAEKNCICGETNTRNCPVHQ